jgi:hypothetical protein
MVKKYDKSSLEKNLSLIFVSFFCLLFSIGFFMLLHENKVQREKIDSALDLSKGYANRWDSCQEELWDLKNATYYERKGCAYPISCFNNMEDYLTQFPNREIPQTLCTYSIYCGKLNGVSKNE